MEQRPQPKLQFDQLRKWAYFPASLGILSLNCCSLPIRLFPNLCKLAPCLFCSLSVSASFCSVFLPHCMCSLFAARSSISAVCSALHLHRLFLIYRAPPSVLCLPLPIYLRNINLSLAAALPLSFKVTSIKLWLLFHCK